MKDDIIRLSEYQKSESAAAPFTSGGEQAPAFSEEALALQFAEDHADDLRYVARWSRWLVWDSKRWAADEKLSAFALARKLCRTAASECNRKKIAITLASAKTVAGDREAGKGRSAARRQQRWLGHDLFGHSITPPAPSICSTGICIRTIPPTSSPRSAARHQTNPARPRYGRHSLPASRQSIRADRFPSTHGWLFAHRLDTRARAVFPLRRGRQRQNHRS